jgi:dimethylhistidine N-methyltransferase
MSPQPAAYIASITSPDSLAELATEVAAGLTKEGQKELPSRYLYDEMGSALFEAITVLPEYGLTRAGDRLLRRNRFEIARRLQAPVTVVELGSGNGKKARLLIEPIMHRQTSTLYYPIDLSATALASCVKEFGDAEGVRVFPIERSYLDGLAEVSLRRRPREHLFVLFLGGNIGNFDRSYAEDFLRSVRHALRPGDALLIAADLEKPVPLLLAAYDDPLGVTAAFNMNLLVRLNRELGANFDLSRFRHVARYNSEERRVEMHLRSAIDQEVVLPAAGLTVRLARGETIWTESSHRYRKEEIVEIGGRTGFHCAAQWVDEEWPFAQTLLAIDSLPGS